MSKSKQLTDLIEDDNASASSPRRSSRIATRRLSSCDEIPSSPAKTRSRRPSLTLENNGTPGKITRSKRSSLSLDSDSTKGDDANSPPSNRKSNSPADISSGGPAKRTRRRGSLTNSTQDEAEASTPIPSRVSTRRLSGRRSMSKSPTRENNASPVLENVNLPKVSTPKRRGRKPSVTEKVIPLEAIEETELNKAEEENNSSKTETENLDNKNKNENLETILESSVLDNQDGLEIEKNSSDKLDKSSRNRSGDAGISNSFKKNKSSEILNSNDTSLNRSSKDKSLSLRQNAGAKNTESDNKSIDPSHNIQSPEKSNVSFKRNKTAELLNVNEDVEEITEISLNKSKNKISEIDTSNVEKAENDLLNVLNSSRNITGTSRKSEDLCESEVDGNLSIVKNETVNKSNESDKENQQKKPSMAINENSERINKEGEDLFCEPMEIDDYPPDTSDENIAKYTTPNNSLILEQSKSENPGLSQKDDIVVLSPIISSAGKRAKAKNQLLNPSIILYDACANSTPKRVVPNQNQNDVDSNTPSKKLKDVVNVSTKEDNIKDRSKRNSKEVIDSVDTSESKRITRKSGSLSEQKSEENLNLTGNFNESKTKLNLKSGKSIDINDSDSNEKSTRKLRSSTGNNSITSIDENGKDVIILEESVNKSASKEKSKRKSHSRSDIIDSDQSGDDFGEKSKKESQISSALTPTSPSKEHSIKKSKNLSQSIDIDENIEKSDSKRKSKNLSQPIVIDESIEKSDSKRKSKNLSQFIDIDVSIEKSDSKRKSKNLSQSIDIDVSIEKSDSKRKSKNLSQSLDKDQSIEKSASEKKSKEKSKCLSNLIDVDESDDDDEYRKSAQKSKSIKERDSETNVSSKLGNLSQNKVESISRRSLKTEIGALNKSVDTSKSDAELEATINKFVESYNLIDDNDEHHALLDDQASEGEEDTPSENSCDIPVDGESLGSCDSENLLDESYEHDSFIVSDEDPELLSGNEYDIDQPKVGSRRLKVVKDDDDDSVDLKNNTEEKEPEKIVEKDLTETEPCIDHNKSSEKKKVLQKTTEEDSDLENMSTKPYCGLDPPSVASSRESLSEADKIEVHSKKTENLINLSKASPSKSLNTSFAGSLNISVVEDKESTTRRSRTTSLVVQEQFENYNVENVCDHISKVVNMVYSDPKKQDVNVCLNVSLEFTEKRKSGATDISNTSLNLQLPANNLSNDVVSVISSDEETSKTAPKEIICMDSSTDSDMSDDVDEDISTKYYASRLISKEEDMRRQSTSGVVKYIKPVPEFSSEDSEEEKEQQHESLPKNDPKEQDKISSKSKQNILGVNELANIQRGKKRNSEEEAFGKIKILQSTKLIPKKVQSAENLEVTSKESREAVPSKKMKMNEVNTIRKKKQKIRPSKNLSNGDNMEIDYFPSKILNTITNNKKSNVKPHVVPSKSTNQNSWNSKAASPLKPSTSIFEKKKNKLEPKIDERDFRSRTLNDKSRNKRMDMETLLLMKSKLQQKKRP